MDIGTTSSQSGPFTILRIKRKRNEEPLDALVVESKVRRKKSKGGVGVFQYAQTVEKNAWNDEKSQKALQDRISQLTRECAVKSELKSELKELAPDVKHPSPLATRQGSPHATRRYTIIEVDHTSSPLKQTPSALSQNGEPSKDLEPPAPDFKMYDAIPSIQMHQKIVEEDPEMVKFQSMLSDYLNMNDVQLNSPTDESPSLSKAPSASINDSIMKPPTSADDDYVWDIFYHRPTSLSEWNDLANIGMLSSFPASLFDDNYDSESESELEDEADEDSNAEEYYKNDYPDEESEDSASDFGSGSSDEWHDNSEYEGNQREEFDF